MKQKCFSVDSLNKVTFPAKMKEKGTRVVLANGSLMIKSIEIFISHRELDLVFGVWWLIYSLDTAIRSLIISVTIIDLLMALLAI